MRPVPAPSSRISPPPVARSTWAHWRATQRLKSADTSGAVMKSPPGPILIPPAL